MLKYNAAQMRVFIASMVILIVGVLLYAAWAAYFLLNTIHILEGGFVFWILLLMTGNILVPYTLQASLAQPKKISRADLHVLITWVFLIVSVVAALIFVFLWLFYTNTTLSGGIPFNDYRWCCAFFGSQYCANSVPCVPNVPSGELQYPNAEFFGHFIAALLFVLNAAAHLGLNKLIRTNQLVTNEGVLESRAEGKYLAVIYTVIFVLVFGAWCSLPVLNTLHIHGYPRLAIPPVPNTFESLRYTLQYWLLFGLSLNALPIYLFFAAVTMSKGNLFSTGYLYVTPLFFIGSVVIGVILAFLILFSCNSTLSGGSICNSYEWCCKYFASAPELCANVTPCPNQNIGGPNPEFIAHIVFAFLFAVLHAIGLWVHYRMKVYGIFY